MIETTDIITPPRREASELLGQFHEEAVRVIALDVEGVLIRLEQTFAHL